MLFFDSFKNSANQWLGEHQGHTIVIKREDLIDPLISGNKYRKLKYVFQRLAHENRSGIITFGGAFSNHLAATANAGFRCGIKTIGVVRGEEWQQKIHKSETLSFCQNMGMELYCISRGAYRLKELAPQVQRLLTNNENLFILPEGGSGSEAIQGCEEILTAEDELFNTVCVSVGTGGTISGIINTAKPHQTVVGFNALKNNNIEKEVKRFTTDKTFEIQSDYTFGGYAKVSIELVDFMNSFYQQYKIPLDPLYTGKMLFGIFDLIKTHKWKWGRKILVIHTGGLQGVKPMNRRLKAKGFPQFTYVDMLP